MLTPETSEGACTLLAPGPPSRSAAAERGWKRDATRLEAGCNLGAAAGRAQAPPPSVPGQAECHLGVLGDFSAGSPACPALGHLPWQPWGAKPEGATAITFPVGRTRPLLLWPEHPAPSSGLYRHLGAGKPARLGIHGGREGSALLGGSRLHGGDREASGLGCGAEGPGDPQTKAQDDKSSEV